jgi:tetratricopeptide (TPR) repeat protein
MLKPFSTKASVSFRAVLIGALLLLSLSFAGVNKAQTESGLDDSASDPMKLFERGQNAHARGELERALEFYEEAIKVRPEFPEAEFQRGSALVSLKRLAEAEAAFRRAIELRNNWALPRSSLGVLLVRLNREGEAEAALRETLKLDEHNDVALRVLADIRLRAGDAREALELARRATSSKDAPVSVWIIRAMAESSVGAKIEATRSLDHVLEVEPENVKALLERAELQIDNNNYAAAIKDLKTAEQLSANDKVVASRLAQAYERSGKPDEARRIAVSAGLIVEKQNPNASLKVIGTPEEIEAANSDDPSQARKALKALLEKNPRNAMLLARLGTSYRTDDPAQSLDYFRRASEIEPSNPDYATGYASALVQAHNFADAIRILRRVIAVAPENYTAHANLATALYKQKLYAESLAEYDWILKKKPDVAIAYYFIATAHDNLGEYPEALAAYEAFIGRADVQTNQLEIEKVKLRLPSLRRQIQLGQGAKRKPPK